MPITDHPWDLSPQEAIELQKQLARRIIPASTLKINRIRKIAA